MFAADTGHQRALFEPAQALERGRQGPHHLVLALATLRLAVVCAPGISLEGVSRIVPWVIFLRLRSVGSNMSVN